MREDLSGIWIWIFILLRDRCFAGRHETRCESGAVWSGLGVDARAPPQNPAPTQTDDQGSSCYDICAK